MRAIRGATTVSCDCAEEIRSAVGELLSADVCRRSVVEAAFYKHVFRDRLRVTRVRLDEPVRLVATARARKERSEIFDDGVPHDVLYRLIDIRIGVRAYMYAYGFVRARACGKRERDECRNT